MRCPLCKTPVMWQDNPSRPFCSERCKLIDLGRWASERYRIPGPRLDREPSDEESSTDPPTHEC